MCRPYRIPGAGGVKVTARNFFSLGFRQPDTTLFSQGLFLFGDITF